MVQKTVLQVRRRKNIDGHVNGTIVQKGLRQDATQCARHITKKFQLSQRNNDTEQGAADLASFSESAQRAVAREEPCVWEHESAQRVVAREEPGVQEHESAQQAAARATTENNTTVLYDMLDASVETRQFVDLQCAGEGADDGQPSNSSLS